jgi:hypothetical protein
MSIEKFIGKRILASTKERYVSSKPEELRVLEVSPSGNWARVMNCFGTKSWRPVLDIVVVEQLRSFDREKPPPNEEKVDLEQHETMQRVAAEVLRLERENTRIRDELTELQRRYTQREADASSKSTILVAQAVATERDFIYALAQQSDSWDGFLFQLRNRLRDACTPGGS